MNLMGRTALGFLLLVTQLAAGEKQLVHPDGTTLLGNKVGDAFVTCAGDQIAIKSDDRVQDTDLSCQPKEREHKPDPRGMEPPDRPQIPHDKPDAGSPPS